ncbi:hypothetical protein HK405_006328 [Cladochytrium tenue]|nr:hypothetical protein HK405_006328 [Cladochytrium tenue]
MASAVTDPAPATAATDAATAAVAAATAIVTAAAKSHATFLFPTATAAVAAAASAASPPSPAASASSAATPPSSAAPLGRRAAPSTISGATLVTWIRHAVHTGLRCSSVDPTPCLDLLLSFLSSPAAVHCALGLEHILAAAESGHIRLLQWLLPRCSSRLVGDPSVSVEIAGDEAALWNTISPSPDRGRRSSTISRPGSHASRVLGQVTPSTVTLRNSPEQELTAVPHDLTRIEAITASLGRGVPINVSQELAELRRQICREVTASNSSRDTAFKRFTVAATPEPLLDGELSDDDANDDFDEVDADGAMLEASAEKPPEFVIVSQDNCILSQLPEDVYFRCLMLLSEKDLFTLTSTCREYSALRKYPDFLAEYYVSRCGTVGALEKCLSEGLPGFPDTRLPLLDSIFSMPLNLPAPLSVLSLVKKCVDINDSQSLDRVLENSFREEPGNPFVQPSVEMLDVVLLHALDKGSDNCVEILLGYGASITVNGASCLVIAAARGLSLAVEALLECGADPKEDDSAPLRAAASSTHEEAARIVARLLVAGADVSARAHECLRKASASGNSEVLAVLSAVVGSAASSGAKGWDARSALKLMFEILCRDGHGGALARVLKDNSCWSWEGCLETILRPLLKRAVTEGDVAVVRGFALSGACWRELIKGAEGKELLRMAARFSDGSHDSLEVASGNQPRKDGRLSPSPRRHRPDTRFTSLSYSTADLKGSDDRLTPSGDAVDDVFSPQAAMLEAMLAGIVDPRPAGASTGTDNPPAPGARYRPDPFGTAVDAWELLREAENADLHATKEALLVQAAWCGSDAVLDAVLSVLQPDARGAPGAAALLAAATNGHACIVARLVSAAAGAAADPDPLTAALRVARLNRRTDVVKFLRIARAVRARKRDEANGPSTTAASRVPRSAASPAPRPPAVAGEPAATAVPPTSVGGADPLAPRSADAAALVPVGVSA